MVNMVPHEAFACSCAEGDVVLRQSYKPESYGKLYYANVAKYKETRLRQLMSSHGAPSAGPSTPPSYSSGPSTPPSYSSRPSTPTTILRMLQKWRVLKLQALAWKDKFAPQLHESAGGLPSSIQVLLHDPKSSPDTVSLA
ncbi:hypothetical protein Tco_1087578 [Tanacetum coccineum]